MQNRINWPILNVESKSRDYYNFFILKMEDLQE